MRFTWKLLDPIKPKNTPPQYGDHAACKYCGQDIEFMGGRANWRDRGGNRACCPFEKNGEIVQPKTKHAPYVA